MNDCYFCGGRTEMKKVNIDFRWGDKLFVVKKVPLEVCSQCGEKYYSAKVSHKLDEIVAKSKKPKEFIEVPVFNWQ